MNSLVTPEGHNPFPFLRENFTRVEEEIQAACRKAGRERKEVTLLAVTKGHPASAIIEVAAMGAVAFGESRIQEFEEKYAELEERGLLNTGSTRKSAFEFHLIGHLQSNKAARAVDLFTNIDTVDSLRLAERLNTLASGLETPLPLLLEIKLSPEPAKTGLEPESRELHELLERLPALTALQLQGLLTIPPYIENPDQVRPYFARLRAVRERFAQAYPRLALAELSMGMSHDFAVAIEEGATQVRVGTALFGARQTK